MKLLTVTWYKLKMMLSDRVFFAAMVVIPLLITVSTGFALRHEKMNIVPVAVADEDNSDYSKTLLERLKGKEGLGVAITDRKNALKMLEGSKVEAVFVINKGFEDNISAGSNSGLIDLAKSPSSFAAGYVREIIAGEVMRFIADQVAVDWVRKQYRQSGKPVGPSLADEVIRYCDSQWVPKPLMTIDYREMQGNGTTAVGSVSMPEAAATSAGLIIAFMMFFILYSSGWLIEERINGTLKRLASSHGALGYSFAGNVAALMLAGALQAALFVLVNRILFKVNLFTGITPYIIFGAYLLAIISVSMLLSSLLRTPAQLQAGAPIAALLTGFAGGCFWNFADASKQVKQLALMTPQGWALEGVNRALAGQAGAQAALAPVAVLAGLAAMLLPLSYAIIKRQVQRG